MAPVQPSLFGREPLRIDPAFARLRRIDLDDESWLDHLPGWLEGHELLLDHLRATTRWREEVREMYERVVAVPRLFALVPEAGPGHPILDEMRVALRARYSVDLSAVTMALYRDGNDSVAWHGDRVVREQREAHVATVSLGAPRKFLVRPAEGGPSRSLRLGFGDLLVMGGACQRRWQHAVPKGGAEGPRLVVMFRPPAPNDEM